MQIPLHFKGGAESKGVKEQGGVLSHVRNDVEVSCLPKDLPEFVEVDVSGLEINQVVKLSGLKLPDGVELVELLARPRRSRRLDPHAARRGRGDPGRRRGRRCRCVAGAPGRAAVRRVPGAPRRGAAPAAAPQRRAAAMRRAPLQRAEGRQGREEGRRQEVRRGRTSAATGRRPRQSGRRTRGHAPQRGLLVRRRAGEPSRRPPEAGTPLQRGGRPRRRSRACRCGS